MSAAPAVPDSVPGVAGRPDANPDGLEGAPEPAVGYVQVGEVELYYEIRGSGDPILLVGAADEDAEIYRGIAERLADSSTVVTYDRRGTGRSGSRGWPSDSGRHADDAAALISTLGLDNITVFGASAGGIVALRLALRHPAKLKTVLCYEPGIFNATEDAEALRVRVESAVQEHLRSHPGDWSGATEELGRAAASSLLDTTSLFSAPPEKEWFAQRTDANAESLIRGDLPLTRERFDPDAMAHSPVNLRFAYGTASLPVFKEIASQLGAARRGEPDAIHGMGHLAFYQPDSVAAYIRSWL